MITGLLYEVSRTAGAAMLLTWLCCVCTGLIAVLTGQMPGDQRSEPAYRLARVLAVFGGGCAIAAGLTGIPYHWLAGDVGFDTFVLVEAGLIVLCGVWALAVTVLLPRHHARSR